jgi:hypothetical protein
VASLLILVLLPAPAAAQSSQFSTRGLGLPVRAYSPAALGAGGGTAMFDTESALNPASLGSLFGLQAHGSALSSWRTSTNPVGQASGRDTRFPVFQVAGPVSTSEQGAVRLVAGVSLSAYADRNLTIATSDTLTIRDVLLEVRDTVRTLGGLGDIRLGAAWNFSPEITLGAGLHLLAGSAQVRATRIVMSPLYQPAVQVGEVSYLAFGASVGVQARLGDRLALAGTARFDAPARVERDTIRVGDLTMPLMLGAGVQYAAHARLQVSGHLLHRGWSRSQASIEALGGQEARDVIEVAAGFTWGSSSRNVTRWPLRMGVHYTELPFPVEAGGKGREIGVSLGTGVRMGLGGRGSFDIALQRIWRSEGTAYRENAFQLTTGFSVRPTN